MNAIILAGGFGSRLKPLTDTEPKPMLKLACVPMLDYVVSGLYAHYIKDMIFTLGYKGERVESYAKGYRDVNARFTCEDTPLGTAGAVKKAENMLDEKFIVISGDGLSNIDLDGMIVRHYESGAEITMAVTSVKNPTLYGVVCTDFLDNVTGFYEKPSTLEYGNLVNTGVYIINKSVLELVPKNEFFDFSKNLFPYFVGSGKMKVFRHDGYWCDIGDKKSFYRANFRMKHGGFYERAPRKETESLIKMGTNILDSSAIVLGRAHNSILGKGVRIASSADLDGCVVLDGVTVTERYRNAIIGDGFVEYVDSMPIKSDLTSIGTNKMLQFSF